MFKIGFFISVKRKDVIVRKWNKEIDEFCPLDEDSERGYVEGVRNYAFDNFLGPYNIDRLSI